MDRTRMTNDDSPDTDGTDPRLVVQCGANFGDFCARFGNDVPREPTLGRHPIVT
jgi:hypothetical protein